MIVVAIWLDKFARVFQKYEKQKKQGLCGVCEVGLFVIVNDSEIRKLFHSAGLLAFEMKLDSAWLVLVSS